MPNGPRARQTLRVSVDGCRSPQRARAAACNRPAQAKKVTLRPASFASFCSSGRFNPSRCASRSAGSSALRDSIEVEVGVTDGGVETPRCVSMQI